MSNKDFSNLLKMLESRIDLAESSVDIQKTIDLTRAYPSRLSFDNVLLHSLGISLIALTGYLFQFDYIWWSWLSTAVAGFVVEYYAFNRAARLGRLADTAYFKGILIDNNLAPSDIYVDDLQQRFAGFDLGNHENEIISSYESKDGFSIFHYQYVERTTTTKDEGEDEDEDTTYNRYGIIAPANNFHGVIIGSHSLVDSSLGEQFKPAYNKFNRVLKAYGPDQLAVARMITPLVSEGLVDYAETFKGLLLQVNSGFICITSEKPILEFQKRKFGYDTPNEFQAELESKVEIKTLGILLNLIKLIYRK